MVFVKCKNILNFLVLINMVILLLPLQASGQTLGNLIGVARHTADQIDNFEQAVLTQKKDLFYQAAGVEEARTIARSIYLETKLNGLWSYSPDELQLTWRLLIQPSKSALLQKLDTAQSNYPQQAAELTQLGVSEAEIYSFTVEINRMLSAKQPLASDFRYEMLNAAYQTVTQPQYAALKAAMKQRFNNNTELLFQMLAGTYTPPELNLVSSIIYPGYYENLIGEIVHGRVFLQSLPTGANRSNIEVTMVGQDVQQTVYTDTWGDYTFTAPEIGQGNYLIYAYVPGFLRNKYPVNVTTNQGVTFANNFTLLNGDVNADNRINLSDFIILSTSYSRHWGEPLFNQAADLNHDYQVNIFDLVRIARNYGKSGAEVGQ